MELHQRVAIALVVAACAAFAWPALAQTDGALSGRVVDRKSGEPLPGAIVTATGPLLRGPQRAVAGPRGEFLLPMLPPGAVDLDVQHDGYQALTESSVVVPLGETVRLRIELFPDSGQLTFAAEPQKSVIPQGAATAGTVSRAQLALVPYGRDIRSFDAALVAVPGVQRAGTIHGNSFGEHVYRIDGAPVNLAAGAGLGTPLLQDFIEEIEIKRAGYRAEDGGGAGAVVQAATRSGGEALHGSVFANVSPFEAARSGGAPRRSYDLDLGGELGGPIVRDRLFFYGGFVPVLRAFSGSPEAHYHFVGKLDWAAARDHRLSLEAFGDPGQKGGAGDALLRYDAALAGRTFLVQAVASWHRDSIPEPAPTLPVEADRIGGDLRLTNLIGHHALKYGLQASRLSDHASTVAVFAQDSLRLLDDVLIDEGLRYEHDQLAGSSHLLPRVGLSWDWSGRGTSRAFASFGRTSNSTRLREGGLPTGSPTGRIPDEVAEQLAAGLESQVFRDLVAGAGYQHLSLQGRHYDGVTLFLRKPFAENYLLSASYTLSRVSGAFAADDGPHAFKLDLAYLYELDARTSLSLGTAVRLFDLATGLLGEIDLRLAGTRKLGKDLSASLTVDLFNLTDGRARDPSGFVFGVVEDQLPFSLRGGAALSF